MWRRTFTEAAIIALIAALPATIAAITVWDTVDAALRDEATVRLSGELAEGEVLLAQVLSRRPPPLWVDARSDKAFEAGHIPGAVLLNEDRWQVGLERLLTAWDGERPIVVYCDSATCNASHSVAQRLKGELGIDDIHVLHGGWEAWQSR
jgi:rhodanese-related sulfurtransferase